MVRKSLAGITGSLFKQPKLGTCQIRLRESACTVQLPIISWEEILLVSDTVQHLSPLYYVLEERENASYFVSQAREIVIFCKDCKLAAPSSIFRGFGPRFRVHPLLYADGPQGKQNSPFLLLRDINSHVKSLFGTTHPIWLRELLLSFFFMDIWNLYSAHMKT